MKPLVVDRETKSPEADEISAIQTLIFPTKIMSNLMEWTYW
jgi:hypothetical protein